MAVITLTTDIGTKDFLVGAIKGQILQANEDFKIIDITHSLAPFNYPQAAYVCRNAIKNFAPGTFHIIIVNLFDERPDHLLLAKHNGHYIACADNGLLTMILEESPQEVVKLHLDKTQQKNLIFCVKTILNGFKQLLNGEDLNKIGLPATEIKIKNPMNPLLGNNWIEGQIIFVDNFENVTININREQFEDQRRGRKFQIMFRRSEHIDRISETYADVGEGEKLALFNSANYLEIAINKGNAAGLLGLQGFSEQQNSEHASFLSTRLLYQTVKIFFIDQ